MTEGQNAREGQDRGASQYLPEAESLRSRPAPAARAGVESPREVRNDHKDHGQVRNSLEPLRSANALSNRGGGGVPAAVVKAGAPARK